ncbi:MAG TPA: zinc ribbon domain-containing protein [Gemmataceae bacterium]|nr:zinc ribbon domain-containing protein [Gemmataceae bacterium]
MPTYDYHCDACEHDFEEFQSFSDKPLTKCPMCGKKKLRRLFGTGAGVIFKGSGFYETDYRSESYKQGAKADQDKSGGGDGKKTDAGKTDTTAKSDTAPKTETKSEPAPAAKAKESGKSSKSRS